MIKFRTASALAVGAVAALAIGGTALAANADDLAPIASASDDRGVDLLSDGDVSPSADPSPSATSVPQGSVLSVGIDAAKAIVIRAAGGGRVQSIEREVEHGRAVWNVDVLVGGVEHDFDVDLATGAVTRQRVEGASRRSTPTGTRSSYDATDDNGGNQGADDNATDDNGGNRGADDNATDDNSGRGRGDDATADHHGGHGDDASDDNSGHGSDD